jgi:FMN-dependent NADH-azoreductase
LDDIEFIHAEGLAISEASKQQGIASAHAEMDQLMAPQSRTAAEVV